VGGRIFGFPVDSDANCIFGLSTLLDHEFFTSSNRDDLFLDLGIVMASPLEIVLCLNIEKVVSSRGTQMASLKGIMCSLLIHKNNKTPSQTKAKKRPTYT